MYEIVFKTNNLNGKVEKVLSRVLNEAEFISARNSSKNLAVLSEVREMYQDYRSQIRNGADEQTLKELKDRINMKKNDLVQFNYSCVPTAEGLLRGSKQCTAAVGSDVDFDPRLPNYEQLMADAPAKIIGKAEELGLLLLERSAGKGYHMVFKRRAGMTQEENLRWASALVGCEYDKNAKDFTRVFFSTSGSQDDLLFLNPEIFDDKYSLPFDESATAITPPQSIEVSTSNAQASQAEASTTEVPAVSASTATQTGETLSYDGIPYSEIISEYWKQFNEGKEPREGGRNTLTFELAVNMRCICDFSTSLLEKVIPRYDGIDEGEWRQTIANAVKEPRKGMPYRMRKVLTTLQAKHKAAAKEAVPTDTPPPFTGRMPEPLRRMADLAPNFLKTTVSEGVFGALATHLHGVTFENVDGKVVEPCIMQILINTQSSGKGCIDIPIETINADLLLHDDADRQREDEYKMANPTASAKKKKKPEDIYVQTCESDMTNAGFVMRLIQCERNGHRPIFIFTTELDELTALSTNGKNDITRIIRKAFDRAKYGQERAGSDSISGKAPCRLNFTAATTPVKALNMCRSWVADGSLGRTNLLTIDPSGGEKLKYKRLTDKYKLQIQPYIERLNNATGLIRCTQALKLAEQLQDDLMDDADEVLAPFVPRAVTIAYWKAMILYIMQGKWSQDIANYMEWSLRRDLWVKMHFFGKPLEKEIKKEHDIETYQPKGILDCPLLGNSFTEQQFAEVHTKLGLRGNWKAHLKKLRQRGKIEYDDTACMYLKVK